MIKKCPCGKDFERTSNAKKYCSEECLKLHCRQSYRDTHKEEMKKLNKRRYPTAHIKKTKNCICCGKEFETETKQKRYCSGSCKTKQWEVSHPEKKLKRWHGLSLEDKHNMYEVQAHKCLICKQEFLENMLCIDHNHINNIVRGLLCNSCNAILGYSKENIETLQNAIVYLKEQL